MIRYEKNDFSGEGLGDASLARCKEILKYRDIACEKEIISYISKKSKFCQDAALKILGYVADNPKDINVARDAVKDLDKHIKILDSMILCLKELQDIIYELQKINNCSFKLQ